MVIKLRKRRMIDTTTLISDNLECTDLHKMDLVSDREMVQKQHRKSVLLGDLGSKAPAIFHSVTGEIVQIM